MHSFVFCHETSGWPIYFLHSWQKIIGHHCTDKDILMKNQNIRKVLSKTDKIYTFSAETFLNGNIYEKKLIIFSLIQIPTT